jgi:trk system potassium uptake protein TrkA
VVTTKEQVRRTLGLFGHEEQEATRIVIAGGGNIGSTSRKALEQRQSRTRSRSSRATASARSHVADKLRRTVVLHGSALDQKHADQRPTSRTPT